MFKDLFKKWFPDDPPITEEDALLSSSCKRIPMPKSPSIGIGTVSAPSQGNQTIVVGSNAGMTSQGIGGFSPKMFLPPMDHNCSELAKEFIGHAKVKTAPCVYYDVYVSYDTDRYTTNLTCSHKKVVKSVVHESSKEPVSQVADEMVDKMKQECEKCRVADSTYKLFNIGLIDHPITSMVAELSSLYETNMHIKSHKINNGSVCALMLSCEHGNFLGFSIYVKDLVVLGQLAEEGITKTIRDIKQCCDLCSIPGKVEGVRSLEGLFDE